MIAPNSDITTSETPSLNQVASGSNDLRAIAAQESSVPTLLGKLEANNHTAFAGLKLWLVGAKEVCLALHAKSQEEGKLHKGSVGQGLIGTTDVFGVRKFQRELGDGSLFRITDFYFKPDGQEFQGEITITAKSGNIARISVHQGRTSAYYNGASHMMADESPRAIFIHKEFHAAAIELLKSSR